MFLKLPIVCLLNKFRDLQWLLLFLTQEKLIFVTTIYRCFWPLFTSWFFRYKSHFEVVFVRNREYWGLKFNVHVLPNEQVASCLWLGFVNSYYREIPGCTYDQLKSTRCSYSEKWSKDKTVLRFILRMKFYIIYMQSTGTSTPSFFGQN